MNAAAAPLPISATDVQRVRNDVRFAPAMQRLYDEASAQITAMQPTCWTRGLCCRFGEAGHRLYVTTLELLYFAAMQSAAGGELPQPAADAAACPYQVDGLCTAREHRPFGCRVYFCQASSAWWQPGMTEAWLQRLKALHAELDVPYAYVEWLAGLRAIGRLMDGDGAVS